ncbi:MAG TPA: hypothetical protein VFE51_28190 [Verrucomicrobiae bacterium]|nr:hypothetical protein [Verrucomicrobiae bacterium]
MKNPAPESVTLQHTRLSLGVRRYAPLSAAVGSRKAAPRGPLQYLRTAGRLPQHSCRELHRQQTNGLTLWSAALRAAFDPSAIPKKIRATAPWALRKAPQSGALQNLRIRTFAIFLLTASLCLWSSGSSAQIFDAAPFAQPLPEGNGLIWDDPREIHQVVVRFTGRAPAPDQVHLEYWGSHWPEQHLPKDRVPGGGDVGWMELGNWYRGGWRAADAEATSNGPALTFTFRPVNAREFPKIKEYSAAFRYTLKLRITSKRTLPPIDKIEAFTDSTTETRRANLVWKERPVSLPEVTAFNGAVQTNDNQARHTRVAFSCTVNPDPNTFDRTLITVRTGEKVFTFLPDDLQTGPLFLPALGVAILSESDVRDYAAVAAAQEAAKAKTLYDRVRELPEQTWQSAWNGMPAKKSHIYFPLGLDGGRQRFLLQADGTVRFRLNDNYLQARPGQDTPRLKLEDAPVRIAFGSYPQPSERHLQDGTLPICETTWETNGLRIIQTAFVTELNGAKSDGPVPPADTLAVFLARLDFTNTSASEQTASLPLSYSAAETTHPLRLDDRGLLWAGERVRGQVLADVKAKTEDGKLSWSWTLAPGQSRTLWVKLPYLVLANKAEQEALAGLDFEKERAAMAGYWRRRMDEGTQLVSPEPVLNNFFRADATHLLINCELEPNSSRRFARVGSFSYGAYGNESCMMVVDLDRRGYHREAQECLDAWLHYQGTVALPGDFASQEGVLYGAGGYESGGYNQHHGWILWMLGEHYRFTRDEAWLRSAAPGILAGAGWIIRETKRTASRNELERGLLPAGSLEDIGDWWTWLSTNCYTWRGLDSAAWALEQMRHPEARRIRREADSYHTHLLENFLKAAARSPVVRLRDGTAVPQIPSYVQRRGRSFGWICETLEGAMHLLITGALDCRSPQTEWILKDYEDNLFLSTQYGYTLDDFDQYWFGRGGMSMQACLLLDVEPYLRRDDTKNALRAMFNAIAVSHFPDVHMNTEHALPEMGDWRGDHFKSSDESNACGWLRQIFVREEGKELVLGQAVPRDWLKTGQKCGLKNAHTYFGPMTLVYSGGDHNISCLLEPPSRNPPSQIRLRFRVPEQRRIRSVTVNAKPWSDFEADWVHLPANIGPATVAITY